jgi:hypothetical protein
VMSHHGAKSFWLSVHWSVIGQLASPKYFRLKYLDIQPLLQKFQEAL